TSENKRVG
ncbi:unnamed protein product, partial [Allacma fusca]